MLTTANVIFSLGDVQVLGGAMRYALSSIPGFCVVSVDPPSPLDVGATLTGLHRYESPPVDKYESCFALCGEDAIDIEDLGPVANRWPRVDVFVGGVAAVGLVHANEVPAVLRDNISEEEFVYTKGIPLVGIQSMETFNHWEVGIYYNKQENELEVVRVEIKPSHANCVSEISQYRTWNVVVRQNVLPEVLSSTWIHKFALPMMLEKCLAVGRSESTEDGLNHFYGCGSPDFQKLERNLLGVAFVAVCCTAGIFLFAVRWLRNDLRARSINKLPSRWRRMGHEVFDKPLHSSGLAAVVSGGIQLLLALVAIVTFEVLSGSYYGIHRHSVAVIIWAIAGAPAGFVAGALGRFFIDSKFYLIALRVVILVPGVALGSFTFLGLLSDGFTKLQSDAPHSLEPLSPNLWKIVQLFTILTLPAAPITLLGCCLGWFRGFQSLNFGNFHFGDDKKLIKRDGQGIGIRSSILLSLATGCCTHALLPLLQYEVLSLLTGGQMLVSIGMGKVILWFLASLFMASVSSCCLTFWLLNRGSANWWWPAWGSGAAVGLWVSLDLFVSLLGRLGDTSGRGVMEEGPLQNPFTESGAELLSQMIMSLASGAIFSLVLGSVSLLSSLLFIFLIFSHSSFL